MAMTWQALANYFSVQSIQCGEQRRGPIALIVVSRGSCSALFHRQTRLGAIESFNLTFLIHAQHKGVFRGIKIQSDYVLELLNKMWVAT